MQSQDFAILLKYKNASPREHFLRLQQGMFLQDVLLLEQKGWVKVEIWDRKLRYGIELCSGAASDLMNNGISFYQHWWVLSSNWMTVEICTVPRSTTLGIQRYALETLYNDKVTPVPRLLWRLRHGPVPPYSCQRALSLWGKCSPRNYHHP